MTLASDHLAGAESVLDDLVLANHILFRERVLDGFGHVSVRHPRDPSQPAKTLPIASGAVATSGDYERFIEIDGVRHCHLLDPQTGRAVHGAQSVTVFAPSCLVAGMLATIAMLKGVAGSDWLGGSDVNAIIIDAYSGVTRIGGW